ncbi:hypothetical protein M409DRAFT_55025 [Zasmidium cellare ATCC 36951]|uniref:Mitochondrial transcription factor 1 n=1 Tax=Zasmidium cellare ATCC 36951 TaxID=1080233 RepID=A0A6A6CIX2_ZASCE|nr:uncharacterized protein M409DRAFT_55025 [Zasmidium cellare ATCC 36951]KAF2166150.1 hypothetical protein M409DRAFT_55025 [Zasmidium cellare ATCC 36951]
MSKSIPRSITSLIDTKHPVINTLGQTFGGYLPGKRSPIKGIKSKSGNDAVKAGINQRVDIVDAKLCDDVLSYLAPTLEPYKGCTIIDAQPGACIWSKKLNEFLRPKSHLLMEPEERYVKPFIQPLLDQPGSTFKHTFHAAAGERGILDAFKTALADTKLLPSQPQVVDDDPRLRQLDTSVLVTGNFARTFPWLTSTTLSHPAPLPLLSLQQLTKWSGLSPETFNSQGLVRMLWWLPDQHIPSIIPHNGLQLSSLSLGMQIGAQMTEVVGVEPAESYVYNNHAREKAVNVHERLPLYETEISKLVRRKMDEAGMTIPQGRTVLGRQHSTSETDPVMRSPVEIRYLTSLKLKREIDELGTRIEAVLSALEEAGAVRLISKAQKSIKPWIETIEYPQCSALAQDYYRLYPIRRSASRTVANQRKDGRAIIDHSDMTAVQARIMLLLDLEFRIISLEAHYKALEDQGQHVADLKPRILQLGTDLHSHPLANRVPIGDFINRVLPDQLAFFSTPPLLPFDRRSYEPLQTRVASFWPRHPLALVDILPTTRDLTVPGIANRYEATRTASELLKYLFTYKTHPLPSVLEKIAPNAAKDLIPQVSALADPRKGGRLNPEMVKVRMLTEEMVEGLVRAWFEWPFKPRLIDLALAVDSSSEGEGEGDVEGVAIEE